MYERLPEIKNRFASFVAIGASTLALLGCNEITNEEVLEKISASQIELAQKNIELVGKNEIQQFTSDETGLKINVYTDGDLSISKQAIDDSINAVFHTSPQEIIEISKNTDRSQYSDEALSAIDKLTDASNAGQFEGKTYSLIISSKEDTCIQTSENYNPENLSFSESIVPEVYNFIPTNNYFKKDPDCDLAAVTAAVYGISNSRELISASDFLFSTISTTTYKNSRPFLPSFGGYEINNEQSIQSNITHEAIHAFVRMTGVPEYPAEEAAIQTIEAAALEKRLNSPRTLPPVKF